MDVLDISPIPNPLRNPLSALFWIVRSALGLVFLILLLSVIAAVPIVNFFILGYLLEVQGRLARTGKIRYAFPLLDQARRIGTIVLCVSLWLLPLRLLSDASTDAQLIDIGSSSAANWEGLTVFCALLVTVHLCLALARGGGFWCFFRPIKNFRWLIGRLRAGDYWESAERNLRNFVSGLRLKHHFSLGLRGFAGAMIWLVPPTFLFAVSDSTQDPKFLLTILGGLGLILVFGWLPFLHARFASENRFRAMFELRAIRNSFGHAPLAWLVAVIVLYVLSLPLYLFKIRLLWWDAMWLATPVFIVSMYPTRVLVGWAYHRAIKRPERAWFGFRWLARIVMAPLLGVYVFLLFFTQVIGQQGKWVLFEHHEFLLPVPF